MIKINALRKEREDKNITLKKMAELSGLSESFLSQVENGKRSIQNEYAAKVAAILEVKVENIFLPSRYSIREV